MFRLHLVLLLVFLALFSIVYAMPGPGGGGPPGGGPPGPPCWAPPCVPIDGAIIFLLVGGAVVGIKFLVKKK